MSSIPLHPNAYAILAVFLIGYLLITVEHLTKISKTVIALLMAIICWIILFADPFCPEDETNKCLLEHLSAVSQIVLFLLGALAIVEVISIHQGFKVISDFITVGSKKSFLWLMGFITFFLSSVLDNLTTTIVMVTLAQKLLPKNEERLIIGGGIVIAANAGGAWTPIGDVTTTMLWIGGKLTSFHMIKQLFLPSLICFVASFFVLSTMLKGQFKAFASTDKNEIEPGGKLIFYLGVGALVFVPIFKLVTGLPPFMGVLFGLSILWLVTDIIHRKKSESHLRMPHALSKVDLSSTLFFLGILLCVDTLDRANILDHVALWLDNTVKNTTVIATVIGMISAVVDNVPLVAASMSMYDLAQHPVDSHFWDLIAFCAGTGGSMLIIGSAAGVVYMGLEDVDFMWYLRRITLAATVGYFAGIGMYLLLN